MIVLITHFRSSNEWQIIVAHHTFRSLVLGIHRLREVQPSNSRTLWRDWKLGRRLMKERTSFSSFDRSFACFSPEMSFLYSLPLFPFSTVLTPVIIIASAASHGNLTRHRVEVDVKYCSGCGSFNLLSGGILIRISLVRCLL